MPLADVLFVLRRHRILLLAALLVGLAAGWLTAPGAGAEAPAYQAGHVLISNPQNPGLNLDQAALRATTTAVLNRASEALGEQPGGLGAVSAAANLDSASVSVVARNEDPDRAVAVADAVAESLIAELGGDATEAYETEVADLNARADGLRGQLEQAQSSGASDSELAVIQSELGQTLTDLSSYTRDGAPKPPLVSVERAKAGPVERGLSAPTSKPARALLLGGFGLLGGLACAFALDRLDTRVHSKHGAEEAFGYPVIAEIPPLPKGTKARQLLSMTRSGSHFVEAFRGLRAQVALAEEANGMRPHPTGAGAVILITSPLAGEGKTTAVAHLATMLAEVGRSVLVVSGDFRRPRIHDYFGRERAPGLSEVLSGGPAAPDVGDLELRTPVPGVSFLASGAPPKNPSVIVKRLPEVLEAARPHWDFILVDSAPLLVANDSADLARAADGVVVLARSGRTTVDAATRTRELLERIGASAIGLVLIGAEETPTAYRYYRRSYYGDIDDLSWWERRRRMRRKPAPGAAPPDGTSSATAAPVTSVRR